MPIQFEIVADEKRKRNYRTAGGDANCENCEHAAGKGAGLGSRLLCCYSPDVQFSAARYMRCDAHAYVRGEGPCKVSTKPGFLRRRLRPLENAKK